MTYKLKHLTPNEIRHIADLSRAMYQDDGQETVHLSEIDVERIFDRAPEEVALADAISLLSRGKKLELIALTYFGRGDVNDVAPKAGAARLQRFFVRDKDDDIACKISGKSPALAEYLGSALKVIRV